MTGGVRVDDVLAPQTGVSYTQQQVAFARAVSPVTVALILFDRTGKPESLCSATIVHPRVVLTAAHCVLKARSQSQRITVVFERARSQREALDVIVHPAYVKSAKSQHSTPELRRPEHSRLPSDVSKDLALVLLHRPIPEGYDAVPPVLRGFRDSRTSTKLIAGYGAVRASRPIDRLSLRFAELQGNSRLEEGMLTGTDEIVMPSRYSNGARVNVCSGDSGGPIFVVDRAGGSRLRQLAVTSAVDEDCREGGIFAPIDAERATLRSMFDSLMRGEQGADQNPF